jgi:hypothetical protein
MQHVSIYNEAAGAWESKMGKYILMTHGRDELAGPLYGTIVVSFKKPDVWEEPNILDAPSTLTEVDISIIDTVGGFTEVTRVAYPEFADDFEKKFAAWKATWVEGIMVLRERFVIISDSYYFRRSDQFVKY